MVDPPEGTTYQSAAVAKATVDEVTEVPATGPLAGYVTSQSPVIEEAFGIENYSLLAIFKLSKSAILSSPSEMIDGGGEIGSLAWTTLHVDVYDWTTLDGPHQHMGVIDQRNATAALVIGVLKGSLGTSACISLAFDVDDEQGSRLHYLMPLIKSPPVVHETAVLVSGRSDLALVYLAGDPCSGGIPLYVTYQQRMKDALLDFTTCMKGTVPPVGISVVACLAGCLPSFIGTPLLYAVCVTACSAIVSLPGTAVDLTTCSNQLEAAKANAKASYCLGLEHQRLRCPNMAEPDLLGCP